MGDELSFPSKLRLKPQMCTLQLVKFEDKVSHHFLFLLLIILVFIPNTQINTLLIFSRHVTWHGQGVRHDKF